MTFQFRLIDLLAARHQGIYNFLALRRRNGQCLTGTIQGYDRLGVILVL